MVSVNVTLWQSVKDRMFPQPVFVVGAGRSGTSVLRRALGMHPQILRAPHDAQISVPYFLNAWNSFKSGNSGSGGDGQSDHKVERDLVYETFCQLCLGRVFGPDFSVASLLRDLLRELIRERRMPRGPDVSIFKKTHWCAKANPSSEQYEALAELFPKLRIIYVIRNGIDVVHSRTKHRGFAHEEFPDHCMWWRALFNRYRYISRIESAIEVRHEQLVAEPERLFRDAFDHIGVDYHRAPINFVKSTLVIPFDQPTQVGVDVKQVFATRKPPYEGWSVEQRETFKKICGDTMREAGYEVPF